jgi:hypothetical protein
LHGDRTKQARFGWLGALAALVSAAAGCDAILGIPGELRDKEAGAGVLRDGRLGTVHGGAVAAEGLRLSGAALTRRAPDSPGKACAGALCVTGSLDTRGGER